MSENRVVVGVFADRLDAEQAVAELRNAGVQDEQIGVVVRDEQKELNNTEELPESATKSTEIGVAAGGIAGGIIGATLPLLIPGSTSAMVGSILPTTVGGAALGAVAGGFIGTLTPDAEKEKEQEQENSASRTIVIVQADERPLETFHILKRNHPIDMDEPSVDASKHDPEATIELADVEENV